MLIPDFAINFLTMDKFYSSNVRNLFVIKLHKLSTKYFYIYRYYRYIYIEDWSTELHSLPGYIKRSLKFNCSTSNKISWKCGEIYLKYNKYYCSMWL